MVRLSGRNPPDCPSVMHPVSCWQTPFASGRGGSDRRVIAIGSGDGAVGMVPSVSAARAVDHSPLSPSIVARSSTVVRRVPQFLIVTTAIFDVQADEPC